MSDLLTSVATTLGVPEPLVQRSVEARSVASGVPVEDVLAAWAGGGTVAAPAAEAEAPASVEAPPEVETPAPEAPPVAPATAPPPTTTATPAPVPKEVTPAEAAHLPVVVTVPTAGIKERTNFIMPKWLTAVLLLAPLLALFALGSSATGECGKATELTIDVITGQILDCDGSEFTGVAVGGGGGTDFIALGDDIYQGIEVTGVSCAACHGAGGQGNGPFPALNGVLTTFGTCADQIEWVQLGSAGFVAAGRDSYGDTGKTINGGMPSHTSLTAEQLAAVVSFERVRFGGGDTDAVLADCGLTEPAPDEGQGEDSGMNDATEGGSEAQTATAHAG